MEERVAAIRAGTAPELVWLLEHPPLYTAGTSARAEDLVEPGSFPFTSTGRGGQFTYHGPGQRVGYVMLDLQAARPRSARAMCAALEEWLIRTLAAFNLKGERRPGRVGIWIDEGGGRESKIAAIGVRVRHWVSYHGVSINLDPDLDALPRHRAVRHPRARRDLARGRRGSRRLDAGARSRAQGEPSAQCLRRATGDGRRQNRAIVYPPCSACSLCISSSPSVAGRRRRPPQTRAVPRPRREAVHLSFAPVVKKVAPAVVNVYSRRVVQSAARRSFDDPFFRRFFGEDSPFGMPRERVQNSLGSGVIVDPGGLDRHQPPCHQGGRGDPRRAERPARIRGQGAALRRAHRSRRAQDRRA